MKLERVYDEVVHPLGGTPTPLATADDQRVVRQTIWYILSPLKSDPDFWKSFQESADEHQLGVFDGTLNQLQVRGDVKTKDRGKRADTLRLARDQIRARLK